MAGWWGWQLEELAANVGHFVELTSCYAGKIVDIL